MIEGTIVDPLTLTVSWVVPSGLEGVDATFTVFSDQDPRVLMTSNTSVTLNVQPNITVNISVQAVYEGNFTSDNTTDRIKSGILC